MEIYKIPGRFPKEEKFGLNLLIRRAVGYERRTKADYIRSSYIALGSNCELETQILLSGDLAYIETPSACHTHYHGCIHPRLKVGACCSIFVKREQGERPERR